MELSPSDQIAIGIDPDAKAHGVAVYVNSKLEFLETMTTPALVELFEKCELYPDFQVAIENVLAQSFVYRRNVKEQKSVQSKVALSIGRNQQAQYEIMQFMDRLKIQYKRIKPGGGNWAHDPALFERITGWHGRSNSDTRSAAFFGYLILR